LFKFNPELRKQYWGESLWSSGKFYRSIENVTAETIKQYINDSLGKTKKKCKSSRLKEVSYLQRLLRFL